MEKDSKKNKKFKTIYISGDKVVRWVSPEEMFGKDLKKAYRLLGWDKDEGKKNK